MRPAPARLAVAHWSLDPIGLADAVNTVELFARLAARHHTGLHLGLGEVLQLVVDVQVLDAAVETGAVLDLPEAERARVNVHRHAWRGREREARRFMCVRGCDPAHKQTANTGLV